MKKTLTIVGGGSCALMLSAVLDPAQFSVTIYDRNAALGRKFLVAGDGGFNLTHSEAPEQFIQRYTPPNFLQTAFNHFNNQSLVEWLRQLGIETYTGSSGRVFPTKGIRPIDALNAFLEKIKDNQVSILTKQIWKGFSEDNHLLFENEGTARTVKSDITVFCLGGASWPVTGSKGEWLNYFSEKNVLTKPFEASNAIVKINWPEAFIKNAEGKALKNCVLHCAEKSVAGEVVITAQGLEGSGIYPLSPQIRKALKEQGVAKIALDLKPALSLETILKKLNYQRFGKNYTEHLATQLNLNSIQLLLLKTQISKEEFLNETQLAEKIKNLNLNVIGTGPLEDAISTVGGISLDAINTHFELKNLPGCFVIGEMLDYDAPTGGYLLQSCFSMAKYLGDLLNRGDDKR